MNRELSQYTDQIEALIVEHLNEDVVSKTLLDASVYSIEAGGKRFRPYLLFSVLKSLGVDPEKGLSAASAIEMIHTYSLIHDDLPAMDDDEYRRGRLTNHKVFGEAAAVLAGDNLLTQSFNILSSDETLSADTRIRLISAISKAAGQAGMIGGQMLDIEAEGKDISIEDLENIHRHKTGNLISVPVECAAIIADTPGEITDELLGFAEYLGVLFQIRDDILDVTGDISVTGKMSGSDARKKKVTYVSTYGLEGAKKQLDKLRNQADEILQKLSGTLDTGELQRVTRMFAVREQ